MSRPTFTTTFRYIGPPGESIVDLQRLLKHALRWHGFQCIEIQQVNRTAPADAENGSGSRDSVEGPA